MIGILSILICLAFLSGVSEVKCAVEGVKYNYDRNPTDTHGIYNWDKLQGSRCGGVSQSPVNIKVEEVNQMSPQCACPVITFSSPVLQGVFENNGHCPAFTVGPGSDVLLSDIPSDGSQKRNRRRNREYTLRNFHIHYGGLHGNPFSAAESEYSVSEFLREWLKSFREETRRSRRFVPKLHNGARKKLSKGSEHMLDGSRYDGEIHFVFYNKKYRTIKDAMRKRDGLTVLGFFIRLVPESRWISSETRQLSEFLKTSVPRILEPGQNITTNIDLGWFLNGRSCNFFTYTGSLTTPPCFQTVQWLVFREPIEVTTDAWFTLSGINYPDVFIRKYGNFRNIQPSDGRFVSTNVGPSRTCGPILPAI